MKNACLTNKGLLMTLHQVIHLEHKNCDQMAANGWLYAQGDATSNNNTSFVTQSNKNTPQF